MQELECFRCGALNNFGNKFCTSCGEKFQYSCPNCNSIVDPGTKFCSTCAAELSWDISTQNASTEMVIEKPEEVKVFSKAQLQDGIQSVQRIVDKVEENTVGPRRNLIPFIVIVVLLLVLIAAIFIADIFL